MVFQNLDFGKMILQGSQLINATLARQEELELQSEAQEARVKQQQQAFDLQSKQFDLREQNLKIQQEAFAAAGLGSPAKFEADKAKQSLDIGAAKLAPGGSAGISFADEKSRQTISARGAEFTEKNAFNKARSLYDGKPVGDGTGVVQIPPGVETFKQYEAHVRDLEEGSLKAQEVIAKLEIIRKPSPEVQQQLEDLRKVVNQAVAGRHVINNEQPYSALATTPPTKQDSFQGLIASGTTEETAASLAQGPPVETIVRDMKAGEVAGPRRPMIAEAVGQSQEPKGSTVALDNEIRKLIIDPNGKVVGREDVQAVLDMLMHDHGKTIGEASEIVNRAAGVR